MSRSRLAGLGLLIGALAAGCGQDERFVAPAAGLGGGAGGTGGATGGAGGTGGAAGGSSLAGVDAERVFPTKERPGISLDDCLFGSPLVFERGGATEIVVAGGEWVVGVAPESGAELYRVKLPAQGAERAFVISTPALVGHRLVVAYHTTEAPDESKRPS